MSKSDICPQIEPPALSKMSTVCRQSQHFTRVFALTNTRVTGHPAFNPETEIHKQQILMVVMLNEGSCYGDLSH